MFASYASMAEASFSAIAGESKIMEKVDFNLDSICVKLSLCFFMNSIQIWLFSYALFSYNHWQFLCIYFSLSLSLFLVFHF